jgi:hypothetical protein
VAVSAGEILRPDTLALLLFFVVPGFVAMSVYDVIVPTERRRFGDHIIDLVSYSFAMLLLWLWPFLWLFGGRQDYTLRYFVGFFIAVILIAFVSPALLAVGYYKLRASDRFQESIKKVAGERVPDPSPSPWDFFFQTDRVVLIRFHLHSGERFGGLYAKGSNASSHPHPQQIYVKKLYRLDENGGFAEEVENTLGAIINKEDCKMIEFLEAEAE